MTESQMWTRPDLDAPEGRGMRNVLDIRLSFRYILFDLC